MNWIPNAAEKKTLRTVAANAVNLKPRQIRLQPALRFPVVTEATSHLFKDAVPSFNDWAWGEYEMTDLYDKGFSMRDFEAMGGCPMNSEGKARIDFYIYQLSNNGFGLEPVDLVGNVAAIVEIVNGKPRLQRVDA